ncbi:MAG: 1-deoxy-D-xylulose-5-phosphate synthase [Bacteroidales bacterium]|nr:1-deoxy-D-xylulose-5-phosphate synthase [Bacteroidales bacterium]
MGFEKKIFPLLSQINGPEDVKKLHSEELIELSQELRQYIIDVVSSNPGHFGASLGVVELTVALHYVFDAPKDKIIWDVGHQAYGHKILTGRRDQFHTNRKYKGISGFPKPDESEYDAFGVGHSSTSISAALGMAVARDQQNSDNQIVAVIGDGSLSGGMAYEALNNAGTEKKDMLVILNDNNISIDPSVGAMKEYLLDITTSQTYNKVKNEIWNLLGILNKINPKTRQYFKKIENAIKSIVLKQSNLFESLNFRYFGPVDGHDVVYLASVLNDIREIPGPKLLHVLTKKGKGFPMAELNQTTFHSPGYQFDKNTGQFLKKSDTAGPRKYQEIFGETILELARSNKKIIGITPAMSSGSSLNIMMDKLPDRTFDVGIAEQHAVTFAAGLASAGMLPYCTIYSTFLQRAYDQVIHDAAIQKLPMVLCVDRAGLVGADGATHHGIFDMAFLRCVPNMILASPMNEQEFRNMLYSGQFNRYGPYAIRYPRGTGVLKRINKQFELIETGTSRLLQDGDDLAFITIGPVGNAVIESIHELKKNHLSIAHLDLRFLKPLDSNALHSIFKKHRKIITVEDGSISGGMGSAILEFMADNNYSAEIKRVGVPDHFVDHGTIDELYKECGMDRDSIIQAAITMIGSKVVFKAI